MSTTSNAVSNNQRNAGRTRARILHAAFKEIHRRGFHGMRLDDVLKSTELTKGALYYHFPSKLALGYAVVEEVIEEIVLKLWVRPLNESRAPLKTLIDRVECLDQLVGEPVATLGCPLNNLAQEMSPLDEGFRQRLDRVFQHWHAGLVDALERAKNSGEMHAGVNSTQTATIIMAAVEGCIGLAKSAQRIERLQDCTAALASYLRTLVAKPASTAGS
ncbi:MAG: TetR/AcrR family transcriptional regulator [Gammaproteobacteria bacterium]